MSENDHPIDPNENDPFQVKKERIDDNQEPVPEMEDDDEIIDLTDEIEAPAEESEEAFVLDEMHDTAQLGDHLKGSLDLDDSFENGFIGDDQIEASDEEDEFIHDLGMELDETIDDSEQATADISEYGAESETLPVSLTEKQIESAVEKAVEKMLSEKIEHRLLELVEKTVQQEIEKLKKSAEPAVGDSIEASGENASEDT